jgi:hypothetical protein
LEKTLKTDYMSKSFLFTVFLLALFSCTTSTDRYLQTNTAAQSNILQLKELTSPQIQSLDKSKTVVLIPGGILEEHGPSLPSFSDGYWNEKLTDTIAKAIAARKDWDVVVFPIIPLGNSGANDVGLKYSFPEPTPFDLKR